ncbi:MAG TPA: UDP-N-acetylglucosamine 1-carboxyvinyltransferase [Myxococcales bacterium]|jgi:UDP-N-acetylglucosamine 1-carboxyvinyltransferase|nr:UDP-N-acetylglucosamine 1-carboxyvinyltransferase [Myxococcales bacterium]
MDAIEIEGGAPLNGEVEVSGSKNATLPQIAAALLSPGRSVFRNVPELADIRTMGRLLSHMGAKVARDAETGGHTLEVDAADLPRPEAPYELVKTMRASVLVLGPLVARLGRARVSLPGGCAIGARPIDQHLKGLAALGAHIELAHGYVEASAKRLRGAQFVFDLPTVTGTENLMMAAALADGRTVLENCAREPEVTALAAVLTRMGARIEGAGTSIVTVEGVRELRAADVEVIPDRIEAGTLLAAALISGGNVLVRRARAEDLDALLVKMREAGATVVAERDGVRLRAPARPDAVDFVTGPFPGFPTDLQAQLMACMTVAQGAARVVETVFENRFMHVQELSRMGAEIHVDGHTAVVKGVPKLSGAPVMATDLRASASLVLAGLRAEGITTVHRVYHLDRGYEALEKKLRALGARVRRVQARGP